MICPQCGSEYRDGFTRCGDCDVDLVAEAAYDSRREIELVEVMESGDANEIAVFESMLDDAGIDYSTTTKRLQHLIAGGALGGYNYAIGPVRFFVRDEDEAEARAIAASLREDQPTVE